MRPSPCCAYDDGPRASAARSRALFPELLRASTATRPSGSCSTATRRCRRGPGGRRRSRATSTPGRTTRKLRARSALGATPPEVSCLCSVSPMAKDTEKLIRQLSLISFLMAERRPVTALEIKQDVEGYSQMNDEAFARRFYADRAELESLGIHLKVDKPAEGYYEAENYSLPPENFYLPAIEFTDKELGALRTSLSLARRRVRLRRAAAAGAPAAVVGQAVAARRAGAAERRAGGHRGRGRARALAAAVEDRDRDLPPQDDPVRLLHDRPRRPGEAQGGPVPPALPRRAVLPDRLLARARRRARVPGVAHPREGRLLVEGRARLQPARGLRPARVRHAHGLAARRPGGARPDLALGPHRLAGAAPLRPRRRGARRRRRRDLRDRLRELAPDGVVGAGTRRAGPHRGPGGARRGGARAARARHGAPRAAAGAGAPRRGGAGRPSPRTTRTAARRRSGPSGSRGSSRSPGS